MVHILGKLRLIHHSGHMLEYCVLERSVVLGWDCVRLGSWWGNGPPSLSSVRVVGARSRRWILRHESRPYGAQQARKLYNASNRDKETLSAC